MTPLRLTWRSGKINNVVITQVYHPELLFCCLFVTGTLLLAWSRLSLTLAG